MRCSPWGHPRHSSWGLHCLPERPWGQMGTTHSRSAGPEGQQQQEESLWKPGFREMAEQHPHNGSHSQFPQRVRLLPRAELFGMRMTKHNLQSGGPHEQASLLWAPG